MKSVYKFENGLILIYERKKVKTTSLVVNVNVGSINETKKEKGIAHLVEHLVFKSSKKYTTDEITKKFDITGGYNNAFTTYDMTNFYFTVPHEYFEDSTELLSNILFDKNISEEEFEKEKSVVIQELNNYKDDIDSVAFDFYTKIFWDIEPIVGYEETLSKIKLKDVYNFMKTYYQPSNMVISVCSSLPARKIFKTVYKYFSMPSNNDYIPKKEKVWKKYSKKIKRNLYAETKPQKKFSNDLSIIGLSCKDKNPIIQTVIGNILTTSSSSILFQELREKLGLIYGIHRDTVFIPNTSIDEMLLIASTNKKNTKKFISNIKKIFENIDSLITEDNLTIIKNKMKCKEYTSSDYAFLNLNFYRDEYFPLKYTVKKYEKDILKVTLEEVKSEIITLLDPDNICSLVLK